MNSFNKDVVRSIRGSIGRFLAIAGIVALGVGFFAGLHMTCPDMKIAADEYYDNTNLMDLRVASTLGMTDTDISILRSVEGVEAVMPAYELDVLAEVHSKQYVIRTHSLPKSALESDSSSGTSVESDDPNYINRLILEEGRWPEKTGECVVSADAVLDEPLEIGDTITCTTGTLEVKDTLATTTYTVVGLVHSPYYTGCADMGTASIGGGSVESFMYIPESDFLSDVPYTEAFITVKGASEYTSGTDEYQACIDEVKARIDELAPARAAARTEEYKNEAQAKLDKAKAEAEEELGSAKSELDSAASEIASGKAQYASGLSEYNSGLSEYYTTKAMTEQEIAEARAEIATSKASYQSQLDEVNNYLPSLKEARDLAYALLQATPSTSADYQAVLQAYQIAESYYTQALSGVEQLEYAISQCDAYSAEVDAAEASANEQLAAARSQLDSAASELASASAEIASGESEYASGLSEYERAVKIAEAELAEAQAGVDSIPGAEWYVLDRTKNYGTEAYRLDAERIDKIATIFPLFFFLVAALVALTTMTRMVDEERVLIGTYKALGYSKGRITGKYIIYAGAASAAGSLVGLIIMPKVIPAVVMIAYGILYYVPQTDLPLIPSTTIISAVLGIGITLVATWAAASSTLREKPALLMLPRAPKAGKRILLERITILWNRLNFSWKVTFRNLFLYKNRFFMTVIGIAGCTALVLTGLGLRGSINDIMDLQYEEIVFYNTIVSTDEYMTDASKKKVETLLNDESNCTTYAWAGNRAMKASPVDSGDVSLDIIIPKDTETMSQLISWHDRLTGEEQVLTDSGAIVTEKLATLMDVEIGDTIRVYDQDKTGMIMETYYDIPVSGIAENYIWDYIYMTPALYKQVFGKDVVFTTIYADLVGDFDTRDALGLKLRDIDGVDTVVSEDATVETYRDMISSIDLIVWVLIISAGLLAFIVLYNLININICERTREIATLKVLGFLPKEVSSYIYRETLLLSIVGALVGLVIGIFLEGTVVTSAEVDGVMWGRTIHAISYVLSFIITIIFTLFVMLVMHRKLRNVNMIESLKSVE